MSPRQWCRILFAMFALSVIGTAAWADSADQPSPPDPFKDLYEGYRPPFLEYVSRPSDERMKLSTEATFFTLNQIHADDRANALVEAARNREAQELYREAVQIYQMVIDNYPHDLYRVSPYGVFVPVSQYAQRRLLNLPPTALDYYRTVHDARAREVYESARRQHSLIDLSRVVDQMLATSYGSKAMHTLGNAALDSGHNLAALEYYTTVRDFFPDPISRSRELGLKIALSRRLLGEEVDLDEIAKGEGNPESRINTALEEMVRTADPKEEPFHSQQASAPNVSGEDYTLFPPSDDPMALAEPEWRTPVPGAGSAPRGPADFSVYSHPVVTEESVIYRHRNIVYARSILNGEYRWVTDLGGQSFWQNWDARQYPLERVVVSDGMVFTVVSSGGPSLVALDEITGELRWAYGPMVAATAEEARMRFEAAPAVGPRTVYIGYVLDNIEGDTHTDTEYGMMAFDSTTGRQLWRVPLARLAPGHFAAGFAQRVRNRIRSFTSPPLYHQGTVYYGTNAGSVAALDARSGRVKWLMRYPYYIEGETGVHDQTRQFGSGGGPVSYTTIRFRPHNPMFWFNQRPMLIGDRLYILPVDAGYMMCLDRRTGKVLWTKRKGVRYDSRSWQRIVRSHGGFTHLLGALDTGELVLAYSFPKSPVMLVDPETGETIWPTVADHPPTSETARQSGFPDDHSPDRGHDQNWGRRWPPICDTIHSVERETHPSMSLGTPAAGLGQHSSTPMNNQHYELGARPMLCRDGKLYLTQWNYIGWPVYAWTSSLAVYDLRERKVIHRRRYYSGRLLARVHRGINEWAPRALEDRLDLPHKDDGVKDTIRRLEKVVEDTVPVNRYGSFLPFARTTFERYGTKFEFRLGARSMEMVYDRDAVNRELARRTGPETDFARAELAVADARYPEAAELLKNCLRTMPSEDLDFRSLVNQQLYRVYRRLARAAIRSGQLDAELEACLGMGRTASTLADEIETLFALSEVYERRGDLVNAARCLRSIVTTYGHHEYPVPEIAALDPELLQNTAQQVLDRADSYAETDYFGRELKSSIALTRRSVPVYLSTVSPLPKRLTLRAGELASRRLVGLQAKSDEFAAEFEALAGTALTDGSPAEQLYHIWEFPGTRPAQSAYEQLLRRAVETDTEESRQQVWELADAARVCGFDVPDELRHRTHPVERTPRALPVQLPAEPRRHNLADEEGINWLVLEREDDRHAHPELMFLGGRVRRRLDNKFTLQCRNLETNELVWEQMDLRLRGLGQEPGFFAAFVYEDIVVVHGLYDVLAFDVTTSELLWRYRVPFDFEIRNAMLSGDLLLLSGMTETMALYIATDSPTGELAWQVQEFGDQYAPPYVVGDRIVSVRMNPFNVTVRYRATGNLIGRLDLPDLSMNTRHPLFDEGKGPEGLPVAHHNNLLALTDTWYYLLIDVEKPAVLWKRQIDNMDDTRLPAMRFALSDEYLAVIKEDYDVKTIYMLSTETGEVLWHTDPDDARSPQPVYSMMIDGDGLYGIGLHPGQGFYITKLDCRTGRRLFHQEVAGYQEEPEVKLVPRKYTDGETEHGFITVRDRQDYYVLIADLNSGEVVHQVKMDGTGSFGVHGRVSATLQNGRVVMMSRDDLEM